VTGLTRAQLLSRTAAGGVALAVGGGVLAAEASTASGAVGPADIPVVTLALACELLGAEFYTEALAAKVFDRQETRYLTRALFNEGEHYTANAKFLTDAGQTPGQASDFDFTFPAKAFASRKSAAQLGMELETAFLGIYLGGVASLQDAGTRAVFARIAASQSEHLGLFSGIVFGKPIGLSFPVPLSVEDGSAALDPFIS
jgi:Ferritin-like domain